MSTPDLTVHDDPETSRFLLRAGDSIVGLADYEAAGATQEQAEGLIDLLAQSATADMAILFKDLGDVTRISIRTRDGGVDATRLAGAFGGGGHARAAGASYDGAFPAARMAVLELAQRLLDEPSAA